MAKIDISTIEGYKEMSPEKKLAAPAFAEIGTGCVSLAHMGLQLR